MNCTHNLDVYEAWQKKYENRGLTVIGIHTPETDTERVPANVRAYITRRGITYPVLLDPQSKNWNRWGQEYWPEIYLIDKQGRIREKWVGEFGTYGGDEAAKFEGEIKKALDE